MLANEQAQRRGLEFREAYHRVKLTQVKKPLG
jgi:hypothetical protein